MQELGFGKSANQGVRLLNPDGSFTGIRKGLPRRTARSLYTLLVTISWPRFYVALVGAYLSTNLFFAICYCLCGEAAIQAPEGYPLGRFAMSFFFSVQTLATIGYGQIAPVGMLANCLVTIEAFIGLLGMSIATGFLFARLSRPTGRILFSRFGLIAPFNGGKAFMFRLANGRTSQLIDVGMKVILSKLEGTGQQRKRQFYTLDLEYSTVSFLTLSWTVVHPIVETSPLWGMTRDDLIAAEAEFLILLTAVDDIFSQSTHARTSYRADELLWNSRFASIYEPQVPGQPIAIDINRLSATEPIEEATPEPGSLNKSTPFSIS